MQILVYHITFAFGFREEDTNKYFEIVFHTPKNLYMEKKNPTPISEKMLRVPILSPKIGKCKSKRILGREGREELLEIMVQ